MTTTRSTNPTNPTSPTDPTDPTDPIGPTTRSIDPASRRVPPLGGLNRALFGIEVRRTLRNRRTLLFTLIVPAVLFLIFGSGDGTDDAVGSGNVAAYVMVSIALYGGALTATAAGANVAIERAQGWSRQLRLTPLQPVSYVVLKSSVALVLAAIAVAVVNVVGAVQGRPEMPAGTWVACGAVTLLCTLTFASLGLFVGYLVPGENAMQFLGPGMAALSFLGGLFIPLDQYSDAVRHIAYYTPMYGVAEIARSPLTHELPWFAVLNAVAWLALFVGGAAWRMSRDTARV